MRLAIAVSALFAVAGSLAAQVPVDSAPPPHRFRVDASALRPGQLEYRTTVQRDTAVVSTSNRTVSVAETNYAGQPSWLVVDRNDGSGIVVADSVTAAKADLRPMHWASTIGNARLVAEFAGDSLYGVATAPTGRRSIVAPAPPGLLVNGAMLETMLRLVPLQPGWQDSTSALSITVGTNAGLFTRLAVTGEETVRVPAGSFDCWIVTAASDATQAIYWVSKRDLVVVRSSQAAPNLAGARVVQELVAIK